jgi:CDP-glycerol glycerophosphotransferase
LNTKNKIFIELNKIRVIITRVFLRFFWVFKIDNNKILFMSFNGLQYSDSPKSISNNILEKNKKIKQVWAFNDKDKFLNLEKKGIIISNTNSLNFIFHILTSKVIIVNDFIYTFLPIRKSQILLNTWHGGGSFKTVGMTSKSWTGYDLFFFKIHRKMTNTFVSSSSYFNDTVLKRSFLYSGNVLECGMPRNDVFFKNDPDISIKVKKHFGIEKNKKIVLYAPTHRNIATASDFLSNKKNVINIENCLKALNKKFNGDFCFLFRAHHIISFDNLNGTSFNATNYPDMQELLYTADVLLTDYSSCMWDFSLMNKPSFVFATDLSKYINERDFFMDIYDWPFPIAKDNDELTLNILNFDNNKFKIKINKYLNDLGTFEAGSATQKVTDWIVSKL